MQSSTLSQEIANPRLPLSVCLITFNEERNILPCLQSVAWADEVVIVDSFSTDRTLELAREHRAGVRILQQPLAGFAQQKNAAVQAAKNEWVLCLDADERVSPALAAEIRHELDQAEILWDGFYLNRHAHYLGRWINHGGWYPDYKLFLFRKSKGAWGGMDLHTRVLLEGRTKRLQGELWHYTYKDLAHQLRTIDNYSRIVAQQWLREGKRVRLGGMLFHPFFKFLETYLYKGGFRDGMPGLIIAFATSFYVFLKYAKHWELTRAADESERSYANKLPEAEQS